MLEEGAEIEGYRIERLLGRGGMGEVYEATQLGLGRRVAFKVLHTGPDRDESFRERFRREGELQAMLDHPNVVTVYEAGEIEEGLFLAMRLVDGVTLKQLIVGGELDAGRTLGILEPVADALDAAHAGGLVHRDVKPQNILIGGGDQAFLADFGLTRGQDQSGFTRSGQVVGTIDYISPEQVRGEPATPASDIYALSGVLYECLTGSVPYARPSDAAVLYAHVSDDPPDLSSIRSDLPPGLGEVVARGMAKEPEERPASARELIGSAEAELGAAAAASRAPRRDPLAQGVRAVAGDTAEAATEGARRGATSRTRSIARPWSRASLLGAAGLAALAAIAFAGGRALSDDGPPALTTSVSSEAVSLRAPGDWSATTSAERPAIPGLALRDALGVAPADRDASGVSAGMTNGKGPRLLPATFLERVSGGLPPPRPVELNELEALRYRDVGVRGFDRSLTLYASPASDGVATVACYSPPQGGDFGGTCESVARTLELTRGRPYPLATPAAAERAIAQALSALRRERRAGRRQLAASGTGEAQAAAARRLAAAYERAGKRLGRVDAGPAVAPALEGVRAASGEAADAYDALAASAASGDAAGYRKASAQVEAGERRLDREISALAREGEGAG